MLGKIARIVLSMLALGAAAACKPADHQADLGTDVLPTAPPAPAAERVEPDPADASLGGADGGQLSTSPPGSVIAEPQDEATYVFDGSQLRTYNLLIAEGDLAAMDERPSDETYFTGSLEFEGTTYGPVGIRYKGGVGAFLTPCTAATRVGQRPGEKTGKCSMKLDFDRVDPDLRFYGLRKLNLHATNRDHSMLRDRLGYTLFREMGIAAPRATHVRVLINGKLEGLYVAVEQVDGRFTRSRFEEGGKGNVYKEAWPTARTAASSYLEALKTNEDDNPSVDKMLAFGAATARGDEAVRSWLDVSYLMKYIAVDRLIINDDGAFHWYCWYNHNYYWYEAAEAQRLWLIPWDLDSSFAGGEFVHIHAPWNETPSSCGCPGNQRAPACDPLTAVWASWRDEYERAVDAFLAGPFAAPNVDAKLAAWAMQIEPFVVEASGLHGAPTYEAWLDALAELHTIIASSREHRGFPYAQ